MSVGTSAFATTGGELPVAIPENETQNKTAPATGEPSSSHAPVIEPDTQAPPTQIDAPAQTTQTPAQPESTDISIASVDGLKRIGADPAYPLDGTYILTNDIDGKQPDGTSAILAPIGSVDAPFTGTLDGGNHKISNIEIKNEDVFEPRSGFFALFDGMVKDLALLDVTVTGNTAGILAGTVGGNAQVSGLFITGSVEQPVFAEDTKEDQIPLFIAGGLAGSAEASEAPEQKIENTAVFATIMEQQTQTAEEDSAKEAPVTEPNKQLGSFIGSNSVPADKFANNIWSSAYGQDGAFGVDSAVNASDGVSKTETSPKYLALMAGQSGVLSANTKAGESFGLTFKGWETEEAMASLSSQTDKDVTVTAGETVGATKVTAVYEKTWADAVKTEVRFQTPVIISQMIDEEQKLEPVDPVFPTQIEKIEKLEPIDDVFPTILSETVPLQESGAVNEISTWEQFINIGNTEYNAAYTMDADYVLSEDIVAEEGDYTPIGTEENPFSGTFDGKEYVIDLANNTKIEKNQIYYGLFGVVEPWHTGEPAEDGTQLENDALLHSSFTPEQTGALPYGRIKNLYLKTDLEVLVQPCDQEVVPGQNVEFNAVANDQPKLSYQWQVSRDKGTTWSDIPGATASQYTFTTQNDESQNGNQYRCRVEKQDIQSSPALFSLFSTDTVADTDNATTLYSQPATLSVNAALYSVRAVTGNPNYYMDGWSGSRTNEANRAMVWFGSYDQWGDANGEPVLNRVLYSDDSRIMLLTEYMMKAVGYDSANGGRTPHYYSTTWNRSSNMRAFLTNGSANWGGATLNYSSSGYLNSFSSTERSWIRDTYLSAENGGAQFNGSYGGNVTDKLFLLTLGEIQNTRYFPNDTTSRTAKATPKASGEGSMMYTGVHDMWSVRTPAGDDYINLSSFNGQIGAPVAIFDNYNVGARPAMNLDTSKVSLVAASNTGGAPRVNATLTKAKGDAVDKNSQWQLAYGGDSQTFRVFAKGGETLNVTNVGKKDNRLQITYDNASYGSGNYLGVMLVNIDTHEKWVARAANINSASGSVWINIPAGSMVSANWELYTWNESENNRRTSVPNVNTPGTLTGIAPEITNVNVNPGGWTTNKNVTFRVQDNSSTGINRVFWSDRSGQATGNQLTDQGNNTYKTPQMYPSGSNTSRTIYLVAYSGDGARAEKAVTISQLDNIVPSVSAINVTPNADGNRFGVSAVITDSGSGVNRAFLSQNSSAASGNGMRKTSGDNWSISDFIGNGVYYIIAYDNAGNRTVSSAFTLKQTSPIIANAAVIPNAWAQEKSVAANVTSRSDSGINRVFFSTTSGASSGTPMNLSGGVYTSTGGVTANGTYYVVAYSNDNKRAEISVTADKIDRTGPAISGQTISGLDDFKASALVTDIGGSGVNRVFISTDQNATQGIALSNTSGNTWQSDVFTLPGYYYVIAYDNVGNRSVTAETIKTPLPPPIINNAVQNTSDYATSKTFSATITDQSGFGLDDSKIFYAAASGATEPLSSAYLLTNEGSGVYCSGAILSNGTYYIVAYDLYGGRSEAPVIVSQVDSEAPHIEAAQNPVGWAQKKSLVATVTDAVSGVDRVFWSTDQNATTGTAMEASGNIYRSGSLTTNGTYYVIAYDKLSNRNVETVTVDKIDTIPPVISDAKQNLEGETPLPKTISAEVSDNSNSIKEVFYSKTATGATGGTALLLSNQRYVSPKIEYNGTYYIYAIDEAGNCTPNGMPVIVNGITEPITEDDLVYWMGNTQIWFGNYWQKNSTEKTPILWLNTASDGSGAYGNSIFLFSKYAINNTRLGHGGYRETPMREWLNGPSGMLGHVVATEYAPTYTGQKLPFYEAAFTTADRNLILTTPLSDISDDVLDKVFLISPTDLPNMDNDSRKAASTTYAETAQILPPTLSYDPTYRYDYVLRTNGGAYCIQLSTGNYGDGYVGSSYCVRPAVNLSANKTMLVPASSTGGAPAVTTTLNTAMTYNISTSYSSSYGVDNESARVFERGGANAPSADITATNLNNGKVRISYSNMANGGDNYIAMLIVNTSDRKKYMARVMKASAASGSVEVTLPSEVPADLTGYKVFTWIESETYKQTSGYTGSGGGGGGDEDTTAPSITNAQQTPIEWSAANKKITATVTDDVAVREVYYSTDATGALSGTAMTNTVGDTYEAANMSAGTYCVYAVDTSGNRTANGVKVIVDKIDMSAPSITDAKQDETETGAELVITANVVDSGSGIQQVYWSTQATGATSGTAMSVKSGNVYTSKGTGIGAVGTYYIYSVDKVGNRTAAGVPVTLGDIVPPQITDPLTEPTGWAQEKNISAAVTDLGSGVQNVYYSQQATGATSGIFMKDMGNGRYAAYFAITSPGTYYIYAVDKAGNRTPSGVAIVVDQIDTVAPAITNAEQDMAKSTYGSAVFHATVTDAGSGIKEVYWSTAPSTAEGGDTGTPMTHTGSGMYEATGITASGEYYIYAVDNAGNRTQDGAWVNVEVQDFPSPVVFNARQNPQSWAKNKTILAQVTDDASTVAKVFYSTQAQGAVSGEPMLLNTIPDDVGNPPPANEYTSQDILVAGTYYVYAENENGYRNKEGVEVVVDKLDNAGPVISGETAKPDDWSTQKHVEAAVSDGSGSGVMKVFFSAYPEAVVPAGDAYVMTLDTAAGVYKSGDINIEGTYYVIAEDALGNRSVSGEVGLSQIDTEGPEIWNYRQSRSELITAVAQIADNGSGISRAFISKDKAATAAAESKYILTSLGTGKSEYETGAGIDVTADGEYYFVIAYDNAGNRSVSDEFIVTDEWGTGQPTITSEALPDGWAREKYVRATVTADTSVDAGNTIVSVHLNTNSNLSKPDDPGSIRLTKDADGYWISPTMTANNNYTVFAIDKKGTIGYGDVGVTKIDRDAPVFGIPAQNEKGVTAFKTATVDIMDSETGSGVARAFISENPDSTEAAGDEYNMTRAYGTETWTTGAVRKEGTYVVIAYDQVGNRAVSESFQITDIDPYPPEIKVPPMLKLGGAPGSIVLYTDITDVGSGVDRAFISTDWTAEQPVVDRDKGLYAYTMTRDGDTNRWQTGDIIESDFVSYYIITYDAAGNRTVTDARYVVENNDTDPPQVTAVQNPEGYAFYKGIVADVTDNMRGIKRVWYSADFMNSTFIAANEMTLDVVSGKYKTPIVGDYGGHEVFGENGTWYVYAEDNNGNVTVRGTQVVIDKIQKDSFIISSIDVQPEGWVNASRTVTMTALIVNPKDSTMTEVYFSEDPNADSGTTPETVSQGQNGMSTAKHTFAGVTTDKTYYLNVRGLGSEGNALEAREREPFHITIDADYPVISNIKQEAVGAVTGDYAKARRVLATITDTGGSGMGDVFLATEKSAQLPSDGSLPEGAIRMTKQLLSDTYSSADVTKSGDYWIIAYDTAGNRTVSASAVRLEKIDMGAPTIGGFTHTPATSSSAWGKGADYTLKATGLLDDNAVAELWLGTENNIAKATRVAGYTAGTAACDIPVNPSDGMIAYYLWAKDGAGNVSEVKTTTVYKDTLGPTVMVKEGKNAWQTFLNIVTFGLYYQDDTTFSIESFDTQPVDVGTVSGLKNTKYYIRTVGAAAGAVEETYDEFITASAGWVWTDYTALADIRLAATPNVRRVIYARAEDNAGNVSYVNSDGMVFDNAAPTISAAKQSTDGWAQEKTISATVADATAGVSRVFWSEDNAAETGNDEYTAVAGEEPVSYDYAPATVFSDPLDAVGKDIYIIAYDAAGYRSIQKVNINKIDGTAPVIGALTHDPLTSISSQGTTDAYTLKLTGVTDDIQATEIWYGTQNDISAAQKFDGYTPGGAACDIPVSVQKGWVTYYIWAKDAADNVSSVKSTTIYRSNAPFADKTDPMYWMGQKTGGDTNRAMVWFGNYWQANNSTQTPVLWRALSSNEKNPYTGQVTLLTEYAQNAAWFDKTSAYNQYWYNNTNHTSSDLRAWLNGMDGMVTDSVDSRAKLATAYTGIKAPYYEAAFKDTEKSLIQATSVAMEAGHASGWGGRYGNAGSAYTVGDKMFLLSAGNYTDTNLFSNEGTSRMALGTTVFINKQTVTGDGFNYVNYTSQWTRSPGTSAAEKSIVLSSGGAVGQEEATSLSDRSVRPALNFDPQRVMFVASANNGGTAATNTALAAAGGSAPGAFSLTPDVGGATLRVFERSNSNTELTVSKVEQAGTNFTVAYSGASSSANNYMGVMLVDETTQKKYIGRVAALNAAAGTAKFHMPNGFTSADTYRLFIWNEYEDGDSKYAYPRYTQADVDFEKPTVGGLTHVPASTAAGYSNASSYTLKATGLADNVRVEEVWYGTQNDITKAQKVNGYTPGSTACDITVSPADGVTTYYVWAKDEGNSSEAKSTVIYKDTKKPTTGNPGAGDEDWSTAANVTITVPNVKDDTSVTTSVSGVAKVLVDTKTIASAGQATAKTMTLSGETATITLPQTDGTTTYYVRAVDGAGNLSDEKTLSIQQDTTPPEVNMVLSTTGMQPTGEHLVKAGGAVDETYVKYRFTGLTEPADIKYDTVFSENAGAVTGWAELSDDGSGIITEGVPKFGVYFSDKPLTKEELAALPDSKWNGSVWGDGRGIMDCPMFDETQQKEGKFIVYARAQDQAGNWGYASTQGYLVDRSNPTVSDVKYEKENLTADGWSSSIKVSAKIDDVANYTTGAAQAGVDEDNVYAGSYMQSDGSYVSMYGFPVKEADGRWSMTFDFWPDPDLSGVGFVPWDLSSNTVLGFTKVDPDKRAPGDPNFFYGMDDQNQSWNRTFFLFDELTKIDAVAPDVADVVLEPTADSWSPSKLVSANITDTSAWIHSGDPKQDVNGKWYTDPDYTDPYYDHGEGGSGVKEAFLSTNKDANAADAGSIPVTPKDGKYSADIAKNGTYYLITIDNVGNRAEELVGTVGTIDFTAPVIGSVTHDPLTGGGSFNNNESYTLKLTGIADAQPGADEAKSGVAEVWYGTQNDITKAQKAGGYTAGGAACDITVNPPEGLTTYYVWVKDAAGNLSAVSQTTIYRDITGPDIGDWEITWEDEDAAAFSLFATETWTNKKQMTITVKNIKDNLSGISDVRISDAPILAVTDGQSMTVTYDADTDSYTATITLAPPEGTTTYYIRAIDGADNMGGEAQKTTWRDYTPATGTIKEGMNAWQSFLNVITFGQYYANSTAFTIESADLTPDGVDAVSGVASVQYYIREMDASTEKIEETREQFLAASAGWTWTDYTAASNIALEIDPNVKRAVYAKIVDHAGNMTYLNSQGLVFDNTAPQIGTAAVSPADWTNQKVKITVPNVTDAMSGVEGVYYSADSADIGSGAWSKMTLTDGTATTGEFVPRYNNKVTTYYIYAKDAAGNTTAIQQAVVHYDTVIPVISKVESSPPQGTWTGGDVTLTVTAEDVGSGVASYSFDNGTTWQAENTYNVEANATFQIKVKDTAGNISAVQEFVVANIDKTIPELGAVAHDPATTITSQGAAADYTLKLTGIADTPSGAAEVWYGTQDDIAKAQKFEGYTPGNATCDIPVSIERGAAQYFVWIKDAVGNVSLPKNTIIYRARTAFTDETDPMYWMGQKTGGDTTRAMVWFGNYAQTGLGNKTPVLWRTLTSNGTATTYTGQVTMITEYLQNSVPGSSQLWVNPTTGRSNNMRTWLNGESGMITNRTQGESGAGETYFSDTSENGRTLNYYDSTFNTNEKDLIDNTVLAGESGQTGKSMDATDKLFYLTYTDAQKAAYFSNNADRTPFYTTLAQTAGSTASGDNANQWGSRWWLRTPSTTTTGIAFVYRDGTPYKESELWSGGAGSGVQGGRPALNFDPEDVMFVASANDGSTAQTAAELSLTGGTAPSSFSVAPNVGGATFRVFGRSEANTALTVDNIAQDKTSFTVSYSGADFGANNHLGVMIVEKSTQKKYIGRVANIADAEGTATFSLPADAATSEYRLFVWNEYEDSDTKYAYPRYTLEVGTVLPVIGAVTHDPATTVTSQNETQDYTLKLTDITNTTAGTSEIWYGTQNDISKAQKFEGYTPGSATCDIPVSPKVGGTQYFVWAKDKAGYISAPKNTIVYRKKTPVGDDDPMYWMGQKTGGDTTRAMVWFGNYGQTSLVDKTPVLWRTLSSGSDASPYGGQVTLLAEYIQNSVNPPGIQFWLNSAGTQSSNIRAWMNGENGMAANKAPGTSTLGQNYYSDDSQNGRFLNYYDGAFSESEKNLISATGIAGEKGQSNVTGANTSDKIFALSNSDAGNKLFFADNPDRKSLWTTVSHDKDQSQNGNNVYNGIDRWYLRTPLTSENKVYQVQQGAITNISTSDNWLQARPALNLDPENVMFVASANDGSTAETAAELSLTGGTAPTAFSQTPDVGGATLRVFERNSADTELTVDRIQQDKTKFTITYSGASAGVSNHMGVMLVEESSRKKYVGRIADIASASGTAEFSLPDDLAETDYRLFIWNEYEDGSTKYAYPRYTGKVTTIGPTVGALTHDPATSADVPLPDENYTLKASGIVPALASLEVREVWYGTENDIAKAQKFDGYTPGSETCDIPVSGLPQGTTVYYVWAVDEAKNVSQAKNTVISRPREPFADKTDPMYWMGQKTGGDTNRAMVWYGKYWQAASFDGAVTPVLWRTLASNENNPYTGQVTLLSEYIPNGLAPTGQRWLYEGGGSSDQRAWLNGPNGMVINPAPGNGAGSSGQWFDNSSDLRSWNYYSQAFNDNERTLIDTTAILTETGAGGPSLSTADKLFSLSRADIQNAVLFGSNGDRRSLGTPATQRATIAYSAVTLTGGYGNWWLRTPSTGSRDNVYRTSNEGGLNESAKTSTNIGMRPALNVDPAKVMFVTSANDGGTAATNATLTAAGGSAPTSFSQTPNVGGATFRVFERNGSNTELTVDRLEQDGLGFTVTYSGASAGANNHMGVMLVDETTQKKYIGRVKDMDAAEGTAEFSMPAGFASANTYSMFIWNEYEDGDVKHAYPRYTRDTVDFEKPVVGAFAHDPATTTNGYNNAEDYTLKATALTDNVGVQEIWYGTENDITKAQKVNGYTPGSATCDITVTPADGVTTYYIWAKDEVNLSEVKSTVIHKDTTAPLAGVAAASPASWTNGDNIELTLADVADDKSVAGEDVSGVAKVLYDTQAITAADQATARQMTITDGTALVTVTPPQGTQVYYLRVVDGAGNMSEEKTVTVYKDQTAPTGTIKEGMNAWQTFLDFISFGLYYNTNTAFTIEADDPLPDGVDTVSGVAKTEYYIREAPGSAAGVIQTLDEFLEESKDWIWTEYTALSNIALPVEPNVKRVVYAKITDAADNVTYLSSDGMLFDNTNPTVGTADGVTVDPVWVNAAHTGDAVVTAAQVADVLSNDVESGVAHAYLMKNNTGTAESDIAYELAKSGTDYVTDVTPNEETTTYWLRAADNAGNWNGEAQSLPVSVQVDKIAPAYADVKQNSEDWAHEKTFSATVTDSDSADGNIISSGIARIFWSEDETAESGNDEYTAPAGAALKAYNYQSATPISEDIGADGKDFYIISYDVAGNRSVQAVKVTKVDVSAPAVQTPVYDKQTEIVTVQAQDALSGLAGTAQAGTFTDVSGVYITMDETALPTHLADESGLADAVKLTERADSPGTFDTQPLTEGYYYAFAIDAAGNLAPKQQVMVDNTPPLIDNVSFTDLGSGKWRIAFTVVDTGVGILPVDVKWNANREAFPNTAVKNPDIENGYYFEVKADVNNVPHYVQATDKNGNAAVREVYDEKNVINVSVPVKLMFASFPNVLGAEFTAPVYTVTNNSNIVKTRLSVSAFEEEAGNEFSLAVPGSVLSPNSLTLYMQGKESENATAFGAMETFNLMPGTAFGDVKKMGTLAVKPADGDDPESKGMFTYAGDVYPYNPVDVPTLRAEFTTTLKFENVRFSE